MGLPELKQELQALDKHAVADAFARVVIKSLVIGEAEAQVDALSEEYPALAVMADIMRIHCERNGLSQEDTSAMITGVLSANLALKELIDVEAITNMFGSAE